MARTVGELPGMADGRSDRGGAWWGHAAGVGRAGVPGTGARRAGSANGQWGGRRREAGPGPRRGGMRWSDAPGWGTGKPGGTPHPLGPVAGPRPRQGAPRVCPAREAAGSAEPTPARTHSPRACSVQPWELPAESLAARPPPGPLWAPLPVHGVLSWGRPSARVGARRPPVAVSCPWPLPRFCSDPSAAGADRPRGWERGCGCHPPLPEARSEAGRPEAWRCGRLRGGLTPSALSERTDPAPGADWVKGGV